MSLRIWLPLNNSFENRGIEISGVVSGGVFSTPGKLSDYCWRSSERIIVPYQGASTEELSVCMWVKPNSANAWTSVFGWGNTSTRANRIEISATGGSQYYFFGSNDCLINSSTVITDAFTNLVWHHFAMVADGVNVRFYLDGELVKTVAQKTQVSDTFDDINTFQFGGLNDNYNGYYNDIRVYDHAISQKEVVELAKGLMIHLPMYCGYPGVSTNLCPGWPDMKKYTVAQYYTTLIVDENFFGLKVGDTFTYRVKIAAPTTKGIKARVQYYTDGDHRTGPTSSITVAAGTTGYSYLTDTITDAKRAYNRMELLITNADTSVSSSDVTYVGEVKLELGSTPSLWSSGTQTTNTDFRVKDCSGYQNSIVKSGNVVINAHEGPRQMSYARFDDNGYIQYTMPNGVSQCTLSFWIKHHEVANYSAVDIAKGAPTSNLWLSVDTESCKLWAYWGNLYNKVSGALTPNTWYHVAFTFNAGVTQWYLNGEAVGSAVDFSSKGTTWPSGDRTIGDSYTGSSYNGTKFYGSISDWRMYATVLTANQIKELYNAPISVANTGSCFSGQIVEGAQSIYFANDGILHEKSIFERDTLSEPDGSKWIQVSHHVNPTTYKFSSSDPFSTGVWRDSYRFLDGGIMNLVDKWEFLLVEKATASAATCRYRWSQPVNPNTATYADVAAANITKKGAADGYTDLVAAYGGIYKINQNTYYCVNNTHEGNWWGAIGAWGAHNGGIPGFNGNVVKDGGYQCLYLRVDNVTWSATKADFSLDKDGFAIISSEFIEQ